MWVETYIQSVISFTSGRKQILSIPANMSALRFLTLKQSSVEHNISHSTNLLDLISYSSSSCCQHNVQCSSCAPTDLQYGILILSSGPRQAASVWLRCTPFLLMPTADERAGGTWEDAVRLLTQIRRAEFLPTVILITNLHSHVFLLLHSFKSNEARFPNQVKWHN